MAYVLVCVDHMTPISHDPMVLVLWTQLKMIFGVLLYVRENKLRVRQHMFIFSDI